MSIPAVVCTHLRFIDMDDWMSVGRARRRRKHIHLTYELAILFNWCYAETSFEMGQEISAWIRWKITASDVDLALVRYLIISHIIMRIEHQVVSLRRSAFKVAGDSESCILDRDRINLMLPILDSSFINGSSDDSSRSCDLSTHLHFVRLFLF